MSRLRAFGQKAGLTEEQIDKIGDFENSNVYDELQILVLKYTRDLVVSHKTPETVMNGLKKYLSERELVELNLTVGFTILINLFIKSFNVL